MIGQNEIEHVRGCGHVDRFQALVTGFKRAVYGCCVRVAQQAHAETNAHVCRGHFGLFGVFHYFHQEFDQIPCK